MKKLLLYFMAMSSFFLHADVIKINPITVSDLSKERELFIKSWFATYESCSLGQLSLTDLGIFLEECFDVEEQKYQDKDTSNKVFHAFVDEKLVGYVSCDVVEDIVYIRQWALLPDFCTTEFFRELMFIIFDYIDNLQIVHVDVRYVAAKYVTMLEELGFIACETSNSYNSGLYQGYKLVFGDKCGTCLCDFDDSDFESEVTFDATFSNDCEYSSLLMKEVMSGSLVDEDVCSCSYEG